MSGVTDAAGVSWSHCHGCLGSHFNSPIDFSERGRWVPTLDLVFECPTPEFPNGRDLCSDCGAQSVDQGKQVEGFPEVLVISPEMLERFKEAE